jgi:hypothetical protein
MKFNFEKDKLIILLLITDLAFILFHLLFMYTEVITNYIFAIWRDRGPAEFFQYMKYLWVLVLFLILFVRKKKFLFFVYSMLFVYFLIDDFFEVHETIGGILAQQITFQSPFGIRLQDLGEMAVYAVVGGLFFSWIAFFHIRSDPYTKTVSKIMVIFILLLAFFGIVLDVIGMLFEDEWVSAFFNFIEDTGEMLVMSGITWFVFRLDINSNLIPIFGEKTDADSKSASQSLSV